jgi:SAM-dependent methyltransferase
MDAPATAAERARHWDSAYRGRGASAVSWFEEHPRQSLELIDRLSLPLTAAIVDVGGGAASLAEDLAARGFRDITVLDVSQAALDLSRERSAERRGIDWVKADVLDWRPRRQFDLWHDRAVFHFLVEPSEQQRYVQTAGAAVAPGGSIIIATFADDGPEFCSGLPVARYSAEQLDVAMGDAFTAVEALRSEHTTPAGVMQPFTWLVARRAGPLG